MDHTNSEKTTLRPTGDEAAQQTLFGEPSIKDGNRACTRCKGEKKTFRAGFTYEGRTYPDKWEECNGCKGEGSFAAPDYDALLQLMTTSRGAGEGKRKMRASMTSTKAFQGDRNLRRATYVHRMACFHGRNKPGDQCMPMMADLALGCDPWRKELDAFADTVAKRFYGTDMRAAARWSNAFGIV